MIMAAMSDPYRSYRRIQVETADQPALLLMLYQGALKFMRQIRAAMLENNAASANHKLGRAQDILCELMSSLNPEPAELSGNLFQVYEYMYHRLIQANVRKEPALVSEVERLLADLLQAWESALSSEKAADRG